MRGDPQKTLTLSFFGQSVKVEFPPSFAANVESLFPASLLTFAPAQSTVTLSERGCRCRISSPYEASEIEVTPGEAPIHLMEQVTKALITRLEGGIALHAGAVARADVSILIPGPSGSGKTSLVAWLVDNGFDYLTDEIAVLTHPDLSVGLPRAMVIKPEAAKIAQAHLAFKQSKLVECNSHLLALPAGASANLRARRVALIVFPQYQAGADAWIESLSPGDTALRLVGCNLNARNLKDAGLETIAALARQIPAIAFRYGSLHQLEGTLDRIIDITCEGHFNAVETRRFLSSCSETKFEKRYPVAGATPRKQKQVKLTVGMTSYDDYDGAFFSLQALRLYHSDVMEDVELLVIDNHPDGPCGEPLKSLEASIPNYRYVPESSRHGTAVRDKLFAEASGEFVLCIDSHVFIVEGALKRLLEYFDRHSGTFNLLQGPLLQDDLKTVATHFQPEWRDGMFGYWALDERGSDPNATPFEIPMQGLGLFACRKEAWPGFNSKFRGFGGEEGYIHEKFRRNGGKVLCLPFLRWLHRFNRPMGVPYSNLWEDRIRNYMIGFQELGMSTDALENHFTNLLGPAVTEPIFRSIAHLEGYSSSKSAPSFTNAATV